MRQFRAWYFRLAGLFHQRRRERELAEEFESHFQLHIEDNLRAGMTPAEARRRARLMFGGVEAVKEAYRDRGSVPLLRELWQDLRYAFRILSKDKLFTAVAALTLALGIGANTAIFSLIDAVMLKSLPVSHPEELLQVTMESGMSQDLLSNPLWEAFRSQQDVFSSVFAYDPWPQFNLSDGGEVRHANGNLVSGDFFSALGVKPALGRPLARSDDHRGCAGIAALSYSFWLREYGGNPAVLGKTISLDYHRFEIVGVTEPGFFGVEVGRSAEVFAPLCAEPITRGADSYLDARSSYPLRVAGRSKPGISPLQVTARLRLLTPGVFDAGADPRQRPYMKAFEAHPAPGGMSVSMA